MRSFALVAAIVGTSAIRQRHVSEPNPTQQPRILTPRDGEDYVDALSTINRFCPVRCASEIIQPRTTQELANWMRVNWERPFTVKGGGHSYGCQSVPADGGILIHTGKFRDAEVVKRQDGSSFLRTGTGLTFDEVVPRLAVTEQGYSVPHGECITVGMGGWNFNVGNHPELKNFDGEWGYNGSHYLSKATFVDYYGTIFTIDQRGITLVELGNTSRISWTARATRAKVAAGAMWLGAIISNAFDLPAVSNTMRLFQVYGASLAIATEMELDLIPKPEPGFFQVVYKISDLLSEDNGKGAKLMKDLYDVTVSSLTRPDIDCGIFYVSGYFENTLEGAIALKCADWHSEAGDNVRGVAPAGWVDFAPKKSGFLFWSTSSYGQGWVPTWHVERVEQFESVDGVEKYRTYLRRLESAENPCDACSSELMAMIKPMRYPTMMFDNLCSAKVERQATCSAFVTQIKKDFLDQYERGIAYKQNLPSCHANPKWQTEVAEYSMGAGIIAGEIKRNWDPYGVHTFWLSAGRDNSDACEALTPQGPGATCRRFGITSDDMVAAEHRYVAKRCPDWANYDDFDRQNSLCSQKIYDSAQPLQVKSE